MLHSLFDYNLAFMSKSAFSFLPVVPQYHFFLLCNQSFPQFKNSPSLFCLRPSQFFSQIFPYFETVFPFSWLIFSRLWTRALPYFSGETFSALSCIPLFALSVHRWYVMKMMKMTKMEEYKDEKAIWLLNWIKSILHHFWRVTIEVNKKSFLKGESPILRYHA